MLSERDLLQYLKYHLAPWKGMLNSWKKIPDHARPKTYLPDGSGPEKLFTGFVNFATMAILYGAGRTTGRI
jgi:hypothetical protein